MSKEYIVRHMQKSEVQIALDWAAQEGWNPGLYDAENFYAADPNGFFIGLLDGEPISVGSAVCYNEKFAFFGLYIVKSQYRAQGYGMQLTNACLDYCADRSIGLDGVLEHVDDYAKIGYRKAHLSTRYQLQVPENFSSPADAALINLHDIPLTEIMNYERPLFPAPRELFLQTWINQPDSIAIGYYSGNLQGYAVLRRCHAGYKIGPLFADNAAIAEKLLLRLLAAIPGQQVSIDIPEPNQQALALAKKFTMQPGFQCVRMYRNGSPQIDLSRVYGITSFELG